MGPPESVAAAAGAKSMALAVLAAAAVAAVSRTLSVAPPPSAGAYSVVASGRNPVAPWVNRLLPSVAAALRLPAAQGMMLMLVEPGAPPPPTRVGDAVDVT